MYVKRGGWTIPANKIASVTPTTDGNVDITIEGQGGTYRLTQEEADELLQEANRDPVELKSDGPTLLEFVQAGYAAEDYPPVGYDKNPPDLVV